MTDDRRPTTGDQPYSVVSRPIRLDYTYTTGAASGRSLRAILQKKLLGQRCPQCGKVYIPPRGSCPACGVHTTNDVEVKGTGTVTTFCIVNIPFPGMAVKPPFAAASVLLDGADIAIFHLLQEVPVEDVRMGLRVKAVWVPDDELQPTMESIRYFKPTGEPDAPYDSYKEHL
jgi:uncharacterized OB-fold protein